MVRIVILMPICCYVVHLLLERIIYSLRHIQIQSLLFHVIVQYGRLLFDLVSSKTG